jgi:Histidine kinase-, DNA gyrase B-, and HSP90-like ATPase
VAAWALTTSSISTSAASGVSQLQLVTDFGRTNELVRSATLSPEDAREKVFDRFYRVDEARSREAGGSGLGLAIAKWAVEAQGGSIGLETGERGGCAFYIRLPIANGEAAQ